MAGEYENIPGQLREKTLSELSLSEQPFLDDNNKRKRFNDPGTQKIRSALEQHLRHGASLHLLLGEHGAGKSIFLAQLVKHSKDHIKPFIARGDEKFEAIAFLAAILQQFDDDGADTIDEHVSLLQPHFQNLLEDKQNIAFIIDNAHLAPIEEIAELIGVMPAFALDSTKKTARLLLTGDGSLKEEIDAIADEFELVDYATTTVPPFSEERLREYLAVRLSHAGYIDDFPFPDKAVSKIHRESEGLPLHANALAAEYLNNVYTGGAAKAATGGLAATLGWPVMAMGALATALIVWGISMFFGSDNSPDRVAAVATPTVSDNTGTSVTVGDIKLIDEVPKTDPEVAVAQSETSLSTDIVSSAQSTGDSLSSQADTTITESVDTTVTPAEQNLASDAENTVVEEIAKTQITPAQTETVVTQESQTQPADSLAQQPTETIIGQSTAGAITEPVIVTETQNSSNELPLAKTEPVVRSTTTETLAMAEPEPVAPVNEPLVIEAPVVPSTVVPVATPDPAGVSVPVTASTAAGVSVQLPSGAQGTGQVAMQSPSGGVGVEITPATDSNAGNTAVNSSSSNQAGISVALPSIETVEANGVSGASVASQVALENERWILFQPREKFTIQLATSRERSYIVDLAQTMGLTGPTALYPFKIVSNQRQVYGLLNGLYDSPDEALAAIDQMPAATRKYKPWIRPVGKLQDDIKVER